MFADLCHHALEESELFPAMGEAGVDLGSGLIRELKEEHKAMRTLVKKMSGLWKNVNQEEAGTEINAVTRVMARILPMHIKKEDDTGFPLADRVLSSEQQAMLTATFHDIQGREPCLGAYDNYRNLVGELEERLGLT